MQGGYHNPAPTPTSPLPSAPGCPLPSPEATCFYWTVLRKGRVVLLTPNLLRLTPTLVNFLPHSPGPPLQGHVPSLHPCILHVAMQTRGCQALLRQWLPCAPAQGVGPWYGLELQPVGAGEAACPLKGQRWVLAVSDTGPPVALPAGKTRATWICVKADVLPGKVCRSPKSNRV